MRINFYCIPIDYLLIGYWLWSAKAKITFLPNYISYFANLAQKLNHSTQGKGKTRLITGKS